MNGRVSYSEHAASSLDNKDAEAVGQSDAAMGMVQSSMNSDNGKTIDGKLRSLDVKVGDRVLFSKYAGCP